MSPSAGPAPGAAGGSGRWSMAKVGHQQPRGVAGAGMPLSPLPHAARHGPPPASAVLGSPRGLWLLGFVPHGRTVLARPRLLSPLHSPVVPGRCSSRGRALWHPARQPGLGRSSALSPWPWACGGPSVPPGSRCCFSVPPPYMEVAPCPRPAGWTVRYGAPGRGAVGGPAGPRREPPRPPEQGLFIHNLVVYFQCYPCPGPGWCGGGGGDAASSPLPPYPPPRPGGRAGGRAGGRPVGVGEGAGRRGPAWP